MAHMQQQVLNAVVAALIAADTRAKDRVHLDRLDNIDPSKLPAILVDEAPDGEVIEPGSASDLQQRTLSVQIRCVLPLSSDTAAACREFGLEVEKAMRTDATRAAIYALCPAYAISASKLEQTTDGQQTFAQRAQDWTFTYLTRRGTPDAKA